MFSIQRQTVYLLIFLSVGQILLISAQVQSKAGVPVLQSGAVSVFSQVQRVMAWFADGAHNIWSHYFALRGAAIENDDLRRKVIELEGQIQNQQAMVNRVRGLESTLGLKQTALFQTVTARVLAGSTSPDSMVVTINRGADSGITKDMAVISADGVVGRVINQPTGATSQVQLLIHRSASVGVKFERTQAGAGNAVGGAGDPPLHLEQIPNLIDVRPGDKVLTSGIDGIFPPGFGVGTVEKVDLANIAHRVVTVRPAVDFSTLDIVLVVISRPGARDK